MFPFPFHHPGVAAAGGVSFDGGDSEGKSELNLSNYNHDVDLNNTAESDRLVVVFLGTCQNNVQDLNYAKLNAVSGTIVDTYNIDGGRSANFAIIYWKDADLPGSNNTYTLECDWPSDADASVCIAFELSNVDQTTPLGTPDTDITTGQTGYAYPNLTLTGESGAFAVSAACSADEIGNPIDAKTPPTGTIEVADLYASHSGLDGVRLAAGYDEVIGSPETFDWTETDAGNLDSLIGFAVPVYPA